MRVAHFSETYLPITDGVAYHLHFLIKHLKRNGIECLLISTVDNKEVTISLKSIPFLLYPNYRVGIITPQTIFKILDLEVDVVHIHTPFFVGGLGRFLARRKNIGCVATYHTDFINMVESIRFPFKRFFVKVAYKYNIDLYRKCNVVISPSEVIGSRLLAEGLSVKVIHHAIDTEYIDSFPFVDVFEKYKLSEDKKKVLFLGRLTVDKGIYTFLEAAINMKDLEFVVAGTGPEENRVRKIASLNHHIKFLGRISDEDKYSLMKVCDIFVLPSKAETYGLTILEAQYCGSFVIGSNSGAIPEVLGDRGLLFEHGNSTDLRKKIEVVLEREYFFKEIAEKAREFVKEKRNFKDYVKKIIEIYEEISS